MTKTVLKCKSFLVQVDLKSLRLSTLDGAEWTSINSGISSSQQNVSSTNFRSVASPFRATKENTAKISMHFLCNIFMKKTQITNFKNWLNNLAHLHFRRTSVKFFRSEQPCTLFEHYSAILISTQRIGRHVSYFPLHVLLTIPSDL